MRISDWSSDVCSSDLIIDAALRHGRDDKSEASNLFAKWLRGGDNALSSEDWEKYRASIQNTMSTTTGSEGGYTVATDVADRVLDALKAYRSEEHTSELQSLMRTSYAVFCLKKTNKKTN